MPDLHGQKLLIHQSPIDASIEDSYAGFRRLM